MTRHFLNLDRFDEATLRLMLKRGLDFKHKRAASPEPLRGRILAMIFEKPSTRTRVSFEAGMKQLGGDVVVLGQNDTQLGRGETVADTARVLSRYVDAIMIRTNDPAKLDELAAYATVPVINGLTDTTHPCQIMADIMTVEEHRGPMAGKIVAWSGDGNNVANTWIQAAALFGFEMRLACPSNLPPNAQTVAWARAKGARIVLTDDPVKAVEGADVVVTDAWVSMGFEEQNHQQYLEPFAVNEALMARAKPNALFLHCLPAHRGEEVTDGVIDGPWSVVWDEAENRLHAQKGILMWCLEGN
ncbi:MAG: ornithine carbamoyltransferase [Rhodospirillales bacterium]|jgi:ornithine carbamoyltransferase